MFPIYSAIHISGFEFIFRILDVKTRKNNKYQIVKKLLLLIIQSRFDLNICYTSSW